MDAEANAEGDPKVDCESRCNSWTQPATFRSP
jgi:hypothetical protein